MVMKFFTTIFWTLIISIVCFKSYAQQKDIKYSPAQLREDLSYLKQTILDTHVNPNSELSPWQYDELFAGISASLTDSMNASDFLKRIKPVIAYLSDEHSQINLKPELLSDAYHSGAIYLPITLKLSGVDYVADVCLDRKWEALKGEGIASINGAAIKSIVEKCALATTGFPGQREATALRQFGYLYPWACDQLATSFIIKTNAGKTLDLDGTTLKVWTDFLASQTDNADCSERLSYTRYGDCGYIGACSFDVKQKGKYSMDSIKYLIDGIFKQISQDGIKKLVIDVSHNQGGNSAVGDYLISYIYNRPYKSYQTNWKRSDEYVRLLKSWGISDSAYAEQPAGKVLHFTSETINPDSVPYPFTGKTVVVIGKITFSSAMTFATLIRDNHITKLVGQTPVNGHPNGFGEMYYTNLPHTQIFVRFGVKEHIRPAGKLADNELTPDVILTDAQMNNVVELIKQIK